MAKTTKKTTKHEFSAEQQFYFFAKTAYETAYEAYRAECAELGYVTTADMTEEQCEAIWEKDEEVRAKYEVDRLSTQRIMAERRLINWSLDHSAKYAPAQRETIEFLRSKMASSHKVWNQLVDIAARLAA